MLYVARTIYLLISIIHILLTIVVYYIQNYQPKEYIQVADRAASFIRRHLYNEQTHQLQHSFRNGPSKAPGFLDDYAFLISGLLDLYEFGGQTNWLVWATELQDTQARTDICHFQVV